MLAFSLAKLKKPRDISPSAIYFYLLFLCLSAKVESDNHQYDIVYVIGVDVARNGEIAPNSDNGKGDDSFNFNKVCKVFKHDYLPLSRSSSR